MAFEDLDQYLRSCSLCQWNFDSIRLQSSVPKCASGARESLLSVRGGKRVQHFGLQERDRMEAIPRF